MSIEVPQFTIEHDGFGPPICLPAYMDRSNLLDITRVGDSYRRYLDAQTGVIYDGAEYVRRASDQRP